MHTGIIDLGIDLAPVLLPDEVFTFRPFIQYIRQLREKSDYYKKQFLTAVIEKVEAYPDLLGAIDVNKIGSYDELLNLIYTALLPAAAEDQNHYRALTLPINPVTFYSSDAFFELAASKQEQLHNKKKNVKEFDRMRIEFCYIMILEKCYNYVPPFQLNMNNVVEDIHTGLSKAYRIDFDTRFIEVFADDLPSLDIAKLEAAGSDKEAVLKLLQEHAPLNKFRFEGFRLMTLEEISEQYAIEEIKNQLLLRPDADEAIFSPQLQDSLKMLIGKKDIEIGLMPVFQVNNKFTTNDEGCLSENGQSCINISDEMAEKLETFLTEVYLKKPKRLFFKKINEADADQHFYLKILHQNGIRSYSLVPIFYNETLTGILEIYTHKENHLDQYMLSKLDAAMPFLSQLLQRNTDLFNNRIETVIKENFTSIQPSVQWKFNEAAWHYLRDQNRKEQAVEIENIDFEKVYPLYGAIDIRNSTVERNEALLKDLKVQFALLIEVLEEIKNRSGFSLVDAKIFAARQWQEQIQAAGGFYQQTELNDFLENDVHPFLEYFSKGNPEFAGDIQRYFEAMNEENGEAMVHMRDLETSMNTVIAAINNEVEEMSKKAQQAFPCFFEKFRTDGVEYDIYLGQSITPDKAYNEIYLKNMRLLQLRSMAIITRETHALLPDLPMPVETTQLIFIHAHPIDIKFRKDERRFDVEGAYNIRYQVVKKRIDKVHIKGTEERLTAPNKIALTYFNQKEADEYMGYIHYLQQEQLLTDEVEYLELEPLQGVVGMRAIRVGVKHR